MEHGRRQGIARLRECASVKCEEGASLVGIARAVQREKKAWLLEICDVQCRMFLQGQHLPTT